jgi:ATP-dependent DNA helicase RecG
VILVEPRNFDKLFQNIKYLKGVGPKLAEALERINCSSIIDLITYLPINYLSLQVNPEKLIDGGHIVINMPLTEPAIISKARKVQKITIRYKSTYIDLIFFKKIPKFMEDYFTHNKHINIAGVINFKDGWQIVHPQINSNKLQHDIVPIYPLTYALTNNMLRNIITSSLNYLPEDLPEWQKDAKISFSDAIRICHKQENAAARERLVWDEFLAYHLKIMSIKEKRQRNS